MCAGEEEEGEAGRHGGRGRRQGQEAGERRGRHGGVTLHLPFTLTRQAPHTPGFPQVLGAELEPEQKQELVDKLGKLLQRDRMGVSQGAHV